MYNNVVEVVQNCFKSSEFIPLHEPRFIGNEKTYLNECIDSTFVSSVGEFVDRFEDLMCQTTGAEFAVATVNGTSALHIALILAGVEKNSEVITQALTFVATANAISYIGAEPNFVDVDKDSLGINPQKLAAYFDRIIEMKDGKPFNKFSGKRISACVPMHTFGFPSKIEEIVSICDTFKIPVVEDAAESLGAEYNGIHTGTFGLLGTFSFNGNKTITCGGGGCIVTNDVTLAKKAKHITTTAKVPHRWAYEHDQVGYNYRLPNLNAALACAQLEQLPKFIDNKRKLASEYAQAFEPIDSIDFFTEKNGTKANYWLNTILLNNIDERNKFLEQTNNAGVMTRPVWELMSDLEMFKHFESDDLSVSKWLTQRIVNIPSSVRI
jgi:aminotransferase in exopolysaccharide biosynthesis